jgi:hypothetical protein
MIELSRFVIGAALSKTRLFDVRRDRQDIGWGIFTLLLERTYFIIQCNARCSLWTYLFGQIHRYIARDV